MLTLLDRYIARRVTAAILVVVAVLTALMVFSAVVDTLADFGKGQFDLWQLVRFVLLSLPRKLYEIFPVATLIGALIGLAGMALASELTAIRAAGVSVGRIVVSVLQVGLIFAALTAVIGEYVAPYAENEAQLGRAKALATAVRKSGPGYWLRDGTDFVNFEEVLPDLSLLNVNIYSFDDISLRSQMHAERARHRGSRWMLEEVKQSTISEKQVQTLHVASQRWNTALTPDVVAVFTVQPEQLSIRYLHSYITHLSRNGQNTARYRLVLWQKLLMPLSVVVMVLLAAPFAFGQLRSGGMSQRVFVGVMLGLAVVIVTRLTGHFGVLYGLNPILAASAPIAVCFAGAMWLLRRAS